MSESERDLGQQAEAAIANAEEKVRQAPVEGESPQSSTATAGPADQDPTAMPTKGA
jgi:Tfp pilus assembly protein PilX